eukprot:41203-Pelagomonas_calceolata.AAC.2
MHEIGSKLLHSLTFTGERERPRRGGVRERARRGGVLSLRLGGERPPRTGDLTEREGGRGERTRRAGGLERREGLATRRGGGLPPRRAWGLARRCGAKEGGRQLYYRHCQAAQKDEAGAHASSLGERGVGGSWCMSSKEDRASS